MTVPKFKFSYGIVLLLSISLGVSLDAQKETVYISPSFEFCKKKEASHYMQITEGTTDHHLEMFDLQGKLRMVGSSSDREGRTFDGYFEFYHPNGRLESKGMYLDGQKVGVWERYDSKGNRLAERMYAAFNPEKQAFFYVEEMPMYEGGNENFLNLLKQKLEPFVNEAEDAQEATTIELGFVVSEQGFVEGLELVKGLDDEWNQRALNELQVMPVWMPGKKSGENVRVWMQLAVNLSL